MLARDSSGATSARVVHWGAGMKLPVHIRERDGIVLVFCPELPGCSATARSEQEALRVLRERVSQYFGASKSAASRGTRVVQLEV